MKLVFEEKVNSEESDVARFSVCLTEGNNKIQLSDFFTKAEIAKQDAINALSNLILILNGMNAPRQGGFLPEKELSPQELSYHVT